MIINAVAHVCRFRVYPSGLGRTRVPVGTFELTRIASTLMLASAPVHRFPVIRILRQLPVSTRKLDRVAWVVVCACAPAGRDESINHTRWRRLDSEVICKVQLPSRLPVLLKKQTAQSSFASSQLNPKQDLGQNRFTPTSESGRRMPSWAMLSLVRAAIISSAYPSLRTPTLRKRDPRALNPRSVHPFARRPYERPHQSLRRWPGKTPRSRLTIRT